MEIRYKCTLKPGVAVQRGVGTKPDEEGFVYLYGDGLWGDVTLEDLETRVPCPIDSEPSTIQEGRSAPGA